MMRRLVLSRASTCLSAACVSNRPLDIQMERLSRTFCRDMRMYAASSAQRTDSKHSRSRPGTQGTQPRRGQQASAPPSESWISGSRSRPGPAKGERISASPTSRSSKPNGSTTKTDRRPTVTGDRDAVPDVDAAAGVPEATFVPRQPGVKDGPWSKIDSKLVVAAQKDAAGAVGRSVLDAAGSTVLLGKSQVELEELAVQLGQKGFRGKQILDGLLQGAKSVDDIGNLPAAFRQLLVDNGVRTGRSKIHGSAGSPDGTQKLLLQLAEGRVVETVGIPATDASGRNRLTVCVSSQVGCPMRCTFCATGKGGFARNLQVHEIVDQVLTMQEVYGRRVSNIVFMGMGEPLLNLPSVVGAVRFLQTHVGISGRSITISTVGVPNAIAKLAAHCLTTTLAVSIHAPNQQLREKIIPSAKAYPLEALMEDCRDYFDATGRRVTFEYTLMAGVNDGLEQAQELAALLRRFRLMSHVNLIPWNPVDESEYQRPKAAQVKKFMECLEAAGLPCSIRSTRGLEAAAACGQLRNRFQKQALAEPALLT